MGTSDYKKLKNQQQDARAKKEAFRFRCIPSGRSFVFALAAVFILGGLTLLFQHVFRFQRTTMILFVLFCAADFILAVMCLLWCATAVFYLLYRAKLKKNIRKLEKQEIVERELFESNYFKPISEQEEQKEQKNL